MLDIYESFINDVIEIGLRYATFKNETKLQTAKKAILKDREMYMEFKGLKKGYLNSCTLFRIGIVPTLNVREYRKFIKEYDENYEKIEEFDI
jgi:hypothetical protein